jgi:hypothetical protein
MVKKTYIIIPVCLHENEYHYRSLYRSNISIQYVLPYKLLFETNKITKIEITPYNTYIIGADMKGNIRMYILPKGRSTDHWK